MLSFDEAKHEYRVGGAVVPHVTGILAPLIDFSMVDPVVLEAARALGVAVHRLVELECKNDLVEETLDPVLVPYLAAFRRFVSETGFKLVHSERRVYHPLYGYAGTLDLEGVIFDQDAIIDLKKSFAAGAVTGLQLAAYLEARNEENRRAKDKKKLKRRFALRLDPKPQPHYRLKEFTDADDFGVFLSLLKLSRWKEKYQ